MPASTVTITVYHLETGGPAEGYDVVLRTNDGNYTLVSKNVTDAQGRAAVGPATWGTGYNLIVVGGSTGARVLWKLDASVGVPAFAAVTLSDTINPVPPTPVTRTITFTVTQGSSGQGVLQELALPGATVAVKDQSGQVVYKATTPANGVLSPALTLPKGNTDDWEARVSCPGHAPVAVNLTNIGILGNALAVCMTPVLAAGD